MATIPSALFARVALSNGPDSFIKSRLRLACLDQIEVTDRGLKQLTGLGNLETLSVERTGVTAAGVAALQRALPRLRIVR